MHLERGGVSASTRLMRTDLRLVAPWCTKTWRGEKKKVGKEGRSFWIFRERHEVKSGEKLAPFERWEDTLLKYKHEITGILHVLVCCLSPRV